MYKRMGVSIATVFIVSLFISGYAMSDEADQNNHKSEFRGYFMTGGATLDIDALNSRLTAKGYSEFSDNFVSFGGGCFHQVSDRLMLGCEGQLLFGEDESSVIGGKRYNSSIFAANGFFNTGYLVYARKHLDIYPILGLGLGGMSVKIAPDSFDDILDNPQRGAELTTGSFLLNVALGTDYKVNLSSDDTKESNLIIGVRFGYVFSPFKSGWEMDGMHLSGDPDGGINGPYVRLTIGGGGKAK